MVVSRYDVFTISTRSHWVGPGGVEVMNMSNLLAMMVEFTSESWYWLVNDTSGGRGVLYRSRIHAHLEKISHICDLGPPAPLLPLW